MSAIAIPSNQNIRLPIIAGVVLSTILGFTGVKAAEQPATNPQTKPDTQQFEDSASRAAPSTSKPHRRWFQIGRASWYGTFFNGRSTASGETYDMNGLTCAHRSLPLGSLIRVTNLRNQKTVVVRVNDRGPVPDDRVIDLSYGAAKSLGFVSKGLAPVRLELVAAAHAPAAPFSNRPER
jgi:rare lipoprotein A